MTCLNCKSKKFKNQFISFSKVNYKVCADCFCVYQDPITKLDYSESYWQGAIDLEGVKRNFTEERNFKVKNWYGDTIKYLNKNKNISVLDIGCGLGFFLSSLNTSIKKYGVEQSSYAINYMKKNFNNINLIQGGIEKIKDFNIKFDVVMLYHVIEHLPNPSEAIPLIKEVTKPGGVLILGTPNAGSFFATYFGKNFRHYIPAHTCLYNLQGIKKLLLKNSFKVFKIEKPFFKTAYNSIKNFFRLFNPKKVSPPFYGSIITLYCINK